MKRKNEKDRSLVLSIGMFAIPVVLSTLIQRLFNVVDTMVAGKFVGMDALAAIGSTGTITGVILGLGMGFSVGTNILVGKFYGEKDDEKLKVMIYLSVGMAIVIGAILGFIGIIFSRQFLLWLNTPADILDQAVLYMRIYCLGMIGILQYDTGGAVLRGMGDAKSPFYALIIAGIANIVIKGLLVIVFDMGILGLAVATMVTQYISAVCVMAAVVRSKTGWRLCWRQKRICVSMLKELSIIGLSSMVEGVFFDAGNLLFQSSLNSFGSDAIAGYSVSCQMEILVYATMNCFYHAALSFTSQNYGAGSYKNIRKVVWICCSYVMAAWCLFGGLTYIFQMPLLGLFTDEAVAIEYALLRLQVTMPMFFFCGLQEVLRASLRGMNYSAIVTVGTLFFVCVFRIGWIYTVFQRIHNYQILMLAIPVSYVTATIGFAAIYFVLMSWQHKYKVA